MSETFPNSSSDQTRQSHSDASQAAPQPDDQDKIVDVMDLVYKGGYSRDPQEILSNPAVAPQMLSEGRDLRVDLFYDAEDPFSASSSEPDEQPDPNSENATDPS